MKKVFIMFVLLCMMCGCSNDSAVKSSNIENEKGLNIGVYCASNSSDYVWLKDDYSIEYCINNEKGGRASSYEIVKKRVIINDDDKTVVFDIINDFLIKNNDEEFKYVAKTNRFSSDGVILVDKKTEIEIKKGVYQSEYTYDMFYFTSDDKIKYSLAEYSNSGVIYEYEIKEEKIILNCKENNIEFRILDNDTVINDGEVFRFIQEDIAIDKYSLFSRGMYCSLTTSSYINFKDEGYVEFVIGDKFGDELWRYQATTNDVYIYYPPNREEEKGYFLYIINEETIQLDNEIFILEK